ncbi:hypothetical protein AAKU55_000540 [Oxalobacteraceae bacterium GrIS 1.11]
MFNRPKQSALLTNLGGAHLPPVTLAVSAQFQFCVDAGVSAAMDFFDGLTVVGLHEHIALSMQIFMESVRVATAPMDDFSAAPMQVCVDAFAAGYLGRIQQELRLFHGEDAGRNQAALEARLFASSSTSH